MVGAPRLRLRRRRGPTPERPCRRARMTFPGSRSLAAGLEGMAPAGDVTGPANPKAVEDFRQQVRFRAVRRVLVEPLLRSAT